MRRQAKVLAQGQPAVFPNARVTGRDPYSTCNRLSRSRWDCLILVDLLETSRSNPDQWALRTCGSPDHKGFIVRRERSSRKLRIVRGWRMQCPVRERHSSWWNDRGDDWQPNVSEPTPYRPVAPAPKIGEERDDLLPAPKRQPAGLPLGPLRVTRASGSANRNAHSAADTFLGCTPWMRYAIDTRYWVY